VDGRVTSGRSTEQTRGRWRSVTQFIRASALGATVEMSMVGAATVGGPGLRTAFALLIVATSFHVFAYVLNDVVDLPIDRTEDRRRGTPLVRGTVRPGAALRIALVQVPVAVGLALATGAGRDAIAALLVAFAAMAYYDVRGKRAALPLLPDAVQGLSWAALTAYGAMTTGSPTALTWLLCGFVVLVIAQFNGLHGGLRDLANDLRCGARTTAIFLGARPLPDGGVRVSRRLARYAMGLQALLVICALAAFAVDSLTTARPAHAWTLWLTGGVVAGLSAASSVLLVQASRATRDFWRLRYIGMLHVLVTLAIPMAVVAHRLEPSVLALLVLAFLLPLATDRWLPPAVHWLVTAGYPRRRAEENQQ
jgi:4-hydroxybenzoate polyprenyltransferase